MGVVLAAVVGYPFPNYFVSQEMAVKTSFSAERNVIVTQILNRFTGKIFIEYISVSWAQAERWHQKAIKRLILLNATVDETIYFGS
jgi:hypothetical protein